MRFLNSQILAYAGDDTLSVSGRLISSTIKAGAGNDTLSYDWTSTSEDLPSNLIHDGCWS